MSVQNTNMLSVELTLPTWGSFGYITNLLHMHTCHDSNISRSDAMMLLTCQLKMSPSVQPVVILISAIQRGIPSSVRLEMWTNIHVLFAFLSNIVLFGRQSFFA